MNKDHKTISTSVLRLAAFAIVFAAPSTVQAATLGYSLSVNDPIFNSANGNFNVPDFQLTNTSLTGASITSFALSIGDTAFNYDFVRNQSVFIDPGSDLTYSLDSVGTVNDGVGDDVLQYSFLGFDPGDSFRFEVDIDPDGAGSVVQDFRNILFPAGSALISFSDGTTVTSLFDSVDPSQGSFTFAEVVPAPVPLPGGLSLLLGALGIGAFVSRRRRSTEFA